MAINPSVSDVTRPARVLWPAFARTGKSMNNPVALWVLFAGVAVLATEPPNVAFVSPEAAKIHSLGLGSDENAVRRALGSPTEETAGRDDAADAPSKEMVFQGVTVYLVDNQVYRISCRGKGY